MLSAVPNGLDISRKFRSSSQVKKSKKTSVWFWRRNNISEEIETEETAIAQLQL